MNTAALKSFAPAVRRQLMEAVTQKLDFVLSARTPDYLTTFAPQVGELRKLAKTDRSGLIERVAYTWFNRFAALRYLDAKGWHPFRARVLTAASAEETQPEILKLARTGALPEELRPHVKAGPARLNDLLDGRIPSDDPQGEVYRHLVLAACHFYHVLLPDLFERLDDETELLLPDDVLTEQSVAQGFRTEMTDSDCAEVEVLGWLYQFYISEKKDTVMGRKAAVPTEDIPSVTQLFTPHWIVRYLVENSLGRLWLLNRPGSRLRERMPYYIEGDQETDFLQIDRPEEIRMLDPAVGSGHMLTYAFDLLSAIYQEEGYAPSDIPGLILTHNLHGLDICPRAAQLSELALVFKARETSRRFFQVGQLVKPRILCLQDVRFRETELREYIDALDLGDLFTRPVMELVSQFGDATTFGSLIKPCLDYDGIPIVRFAIESKDVGGRLFLYDTHAKVLRALEQAEPLARRYHVVVANPPYMGSANMNPALKTFATTQYPITKQDTSTMFVEQGLALTMMNGYIALVTLHSWMFLSSFTRMREEVILRYRMSSCVHIGYNSFPELNSKIAQGVAFVVAKTSHTGPAGYYYDLNSAEQSADKEVVFNEALRAKKCFLVTNKQLGELPGSPIAYWISEKFRSVFALKTLETITISDGQNKTGNNEKYLRHFWEISAKDVGAERRWRPYAKGGNARRWCGNIVHVIDWSPDARAHYRSDFVARIIPQYLWQKEGVTWGLISSLKPTFRLLPAEATFDSVGCSIFFVDHAMLLPTLALLNSTIAFAFIATSNPTLALQVKNVRDIPIPKEFGVAHGLYASRAITLARTDWDDFEIAQGFSESPILRTATRRESLEMSWLALKSQREANVQEMRELEKANNELFIDAYGLQGEVQSEVVEAEITLARASARADMAAFLSFAVGCMMGRYSLDKSGLIVADAGGTLTLPSVSVSLNNLDPSPSWLWES